MKCVKCSKDATMDSGANPLCNNCFVQVIQKRIRKEIRTNKLFSKADKILIIEDDSVNSAVSKYLIDTILDKLPCEIKTKKQKFEIGKSVNTKSDKIVVPWNMDMECVYFLENIFMNRTGKFIGNYSIGKKLNIKLLLNVCEKDIIKFAEIKELKFKKNPDKKTQIGFFLDSLETDHPETKPSLLKSAQLLKKIKQ